MVEWTHRIEQGKKPHNVMVVDFQGGDGDLDWVKYNYDIINKKAPQKTDVTTISYDSAAQEWYMPDREYPSQRNLTQVLEAHVPDVIVIYAPQLMEMDVSDNTADPLGQELRRCCQSGAKLILHTGGTQEPSEALLLKLAPLQRLANKPIPFVISADPQKLIQMIDAIRASGVGGPG